MIDFLIDIFFGICIVLVCIMGTIVFIVVIAELVLFFAVICLHLQFFFFVGCGTALFAYAGYLYGGEDVARVAGVIGSIVSIIAYIGTFKIYWFFFCPYPVRKKCKLRTCHPHYYNWMPIQDDLWYRECYVCHLEYVLFSFKYETIVNVDGTLKPYLKRTKWGWRKDDELNLEVTSIVTPEMIEQVREKWKKQQEDRN